MDLNQIYAVAHDFERKPNLEYILSPFQSLIAATQPIETAPTSKILPGLSSLMHCPRIEAARAVISDLHASVYEFLYPLLVIVSKELDPWCADFRGNINCKALFFWCSFCLCLESVQALKYLRSKVRTLAICND